MTLQKDFLLIVPTNEVSSAIGVDNIKRELRNAEVWLSDFCKDSKLLKREYLEVSTIRTIEYFANCLAEENRSVHDYASCVFIKINSYQVELLFRGHRFE